MEPGNPIPESSSTSRSNDIGRVKWAINNATGQSSDFDLNPGVTLPESAKLRAAAVLICLLVTSSGAQVILTKRSSALKHHPGQISFPGGSADPGDTDIVETALREANEEIGLDPANTEILGCLPTHHTVTAFDVTPVIARVRAEFAPEPEPSEVAEVFMAPLDVVTDLAKFQVHSRYWQGKRRYYYVVPYGPYYIWGATARILHALASGMAK